jgi:prepilin-type N-terminal cleavage/methylation domain-containing protein
MSPSSHCLRLPSPKRRCGFTLLEVEVALIVLAIALAGLCPLLVMQSRQLSRMETQLSPHNTYYLGPSNDLWVQKLGASAWLLTSDPGPPPAAAVTLSDNGDSLYAESGSNWTSQSDATAYSGSYRLAAAGTGSDTATWTFSGLAPGWYDVQATWVSRSDRGTNVPYTILDGANPVGNISADQTAVSLAPGQVTWNDLGTFLITGNVLAVQVSDAANGAVVADAVRVLPIRNVVQIGSLERSLSSEQMTAHVTVTQQVPSP